MKKETKKIKGQTFTKVVWIIGLVFMALMTIGAWIDFAGEKNADSLSSGLNMLLYLAAFVIGVLYLFQIQKANYALICAVLYAAADVYGFIDDVCGGSRYSGLNMTHMIVHVITFLLFAATIAVFLKGRQTKGYAICAKLWWLPSVVSMGIAFIVSIHTELNDTHGFDVSLVVLDIVVEACLLIAMFLLTYVVKNRVEESQS